MTHIRAALLRPLSIPRRCSSPLVLHDGASVAQLFMLSCLGPFGFTASLPRLRGWDHL